jgi:hypothetical protein
MELHHRTASDPRLNMKQLFRGITLVWLFRYGRLNCGSDIRFQIRSLRSGSNVVNTAGLQKGRNPGILKSNQP